MYRFDAACIEKYAFRSGGLAAVNMRLIVSITLPSAHRNTPTAIPIFRTRDNLCASWGARLLIIVSWARFSGSCACSKLESPSVWASKDVKDSYTAAAAPACPLLCCHRRSIGNCLETIGLRELDAHRVVFAEAAARCGRIEEEKQRSRL